MEQDTRIGEKAGTRDPGLGTGKSLKAGTGDQGPGTGELHAGAGFKPAPASTVNDQPARSTAVPRNAGFTLIELMIVLCIIGILASIAAPNYQWSVIKAREAVLRENLYNIRSVIDQYCADFGKYPDSLQDLASSKYMRELPKDPFTGKNDTWVTVAPPAEAAIQPTGSAPPMSGTETASTASPSPGNVYDVHSGSNLVGSNGVAYNEW